MGLWFKEHLISQFSLAFPRTFYIMLVKVAAAFLYNGTVNFNMSWQTGNFCEQRCKNKTVTQFVIAADAFRTL